MKKQVLLRGLLGFPLGIAIGYIITILISFGWGQGYYSPCKPQLIERMGSEINAVIVQAGLCGLIGFSFAASSVIWEIEKWSIAKQTGIYFLITALTMFPVAYFTDWMEHTIVGILFYFGVFAIIFVITWTIQYFIWKNKIKKVNANLKNQ